MFRQYHYLNSSLVPHARCYCALYRDRPIAFIAVVHIHMRARYYRVSRLVVLPDYQGIGVGKRLLNFIAELYASQTKVPFYILTSNPQIYTQAKQSSTEIQPPRPLPRYITMNLLTSMEEYHTCGKHPTWSCLKDV